VGERAFGSWDALDVRRTLALQGALDKPWTVPLLALGSGGPIRDRVREYRQILDRLYRAIADTAGDDLRLLVDSTKIPSHAYLLRGVPSVDLRVLHLVRDSRGVAHSWRKRVEKKVSRGDPAFLPRYGVVGSSARWLVYNAETSALARLGVPYELLRYEDLVVRPERELRRALALGGVVAAPDQLAFLGGREVELLPSHTVEGNPMRFSFGRRTLRVDDAWRTSMSARERAALTALTFPGLVRYGYPLRTGSVHDGGTS
jgi:hypothetical protein